MGIEYITCPCCGYTQTRVVMEAKEGEMAGDFCDKCGRSMRLPSGTLYIGIRISYMDSFIDAESHEEFFTSFPELKGVDMKICPVCAARMFGVPLRED